PPLRSAPSAAPGAPWSGPRAPAASRPKRRNPCPTSLISPCRLPMARPTCSSASEMRAPEASASARASERARRNPRASPSRGTTTALILRATCEAPKDLRYLVRRCRRSRGCGFQRWVQVRGPDACTWPQVRTEEVKDGDRHARVRAALRLLMAIEKERECLRGEIPEGLLVEPQVIPAQGPQLLPRQGLGGGAAGGSALFSRSR